VKSWHLATVLTAILGLAATACSSISNTSSAKHALTNTVSAIPQALTRTSSVAATASTLVAGGALSAPLGMALAPNGDLVVVNGNNGNAVEISPAGKQLFTKTLIKSGAGDLFGITTTPAGELVAVNDGKNTIDIYRP
jgi:glucose/arabinose dehydrogenase